MKRSPLASRKILLLTLTHSYSHVRTLSLSRDVSFYKCVAKIRNLVWLIIILFSVKSVPSRVYICVHRRWHAISFGPPYIQCTWADSMIFKRYRQTLCIWARVTKATIVYSLKCVSCHLRARRDKRGITQFKCSTIYDRHRRANTFAINLADFHCFAILKICSRLSMHACCVRIAHIHQHDKYIFLFFLISERSRWGGFSYLFWF